MPKMEFQVSARAVKLLGRENFSNPSGALLELVKNSYDADATNCLVIFDLPQNQSEIGSIWIIDNGEGMNIEDLKSKWMTIGTPNKDSSSISKTGRVKTGAKGIGRFALDRLGAETEMWTVDSDASKTISWKMAWEQFDQGSKAISEIEADIDSLDSTLKEIVHDKLEKLVPEISEFIGDIPNGTILRISGLKDIWEDYDIDQVFRDLEALIPPKELKVEFSVYFRHVQRPKTFGYITTAFFDDYDYRLKSKFNVRDLSVKIEYHRNELDLETVENNFASIFKRNTKPYDLKTLKDKKFTKVYSVFEILQIEKTPERIDQFKKLGSFEFTFYYLKLVNSSKEGYPYKLISPASRKSILERFGGVKIYRDSFRVRPYGDPGNDWLRLGARRAQSPAGAGQRIGDWRVRSDSTAGIISISRNSNDYLVDKSDRGALQENDTFELFRNLVVGIIHQFELDRSRILHPLYSYFKKEKKRKRDQEINEEAERLANKIIADRSASKSCSNSDHVSAAKSEIEKSLKKGGLQNSPSETRNEVMELRTLASLGLIVSSFAHEIKEIRNDSAEIKDLEKVFIKLKSDECNDSTKNRLFAEGHQIIDLLKFNSIKVRHWLDYVLTSIQIDKRKRKNLQLSSFFDALKKSWSRVLDGHNIRLLIEDDLNENMKKFRAFPMDMETVFSNLINNSIDSFQRDGSASKRAINIFYHFNSSHLVIEYSDNGAGLSSSFVNVTDIFLPFTTIKKDRKGGAIGYGLGMYLVKSVIDDYNGKIEIKKQKKGFMLKLELPLRKS